MRRRILMGIGSVALGVASVAMTSQPASAGAIDIPRDNGTGCFLHLNLGIIPSIGILCPDVA